MKYGKLIVSLLKRYRLLNIIYAAELAVAVIFGVIVANTWQQDGFRWACVREFPQKGILYNRNDLYANLHTQTEAEAVLAGFSGYLGYGYTDIRHTGTDSDGASYRIFSSDAYTSDLMRVLTKQGRWFTQIKADRIPAGAVACVLFDTYENGYQVGDSFTLSLGGAGGERNVTFYVAGMIDAHERIPVLSIESEVITNYLDNDMQTLYNTGVPGENGILCGPLPDVSAAVMPVTTVLYFAPSVSDEELAGYAQQLRSVGCAQLLKSDTPVRDGGSVEEKTWGNFRDSVSYYMAYLILFLTFLTFCFISMAVYNAKILLQRFSVYHLLGMTKGGMLVLYGGYLLVLDLAAAFFAAVFLRLQNAQTALMGDYTYSLSRIGISVSAGIICVYSLILLIPFAFQLRGYAPMDLLNRE